MRLNERVRNCVFEIHFKSAPIQLHVNACLNALNGKLVIDQMHIQMCTFIESALIDGRSRTKVLHWRVSDPNRRFQRRFERSSGDLYYPAAVLAHLPGEPVCEQSPGLHSAAWLVQMSSV